MISLDTDEDIAEVFQPHPSEFVVILLERGWLGVYIYQCLYPICSELIYILPCDTRTHRPPDQYDVVQIPVGEEFVYITGILADSMAVLGLLRPTVASEIESYRSIPVRKTRQLWLEKPEPHPRPMEKHERLSLSVLFIIEGSSIAFDNWHNTILRPEYR
jgi:hypothetical protein